MIFLFLIVVACLNACSSAHTSVRPAPPVSPDLTMSRISNGQAVINMLMKGEGADTNAQIVFLRHINGIKAVLLHPEFGTLDTIYFHLASSFDPAGGFTIDGREFWENPVGIEYDSLVCELLISTMDGKVYEVAKGFSLPAATAKYKAVSAIKLQAKIDDVTDTSAVFAVLAERMRVLSDESFPTSERLRIEILSHGGKVLWNSNHGKQFEQQLYDPIEPHRPTEAKRYEVSWNGRDNNGEKLSSGEYTLRMTLMAEPVPYTTTIPFSWKPKHD